MEWQDQRTGFADAQTRAHFNTRFFEARNFFKQLSSGQHHTIADVTLHARAHDATGNQMQRCFDAIDHQGVACVVTALKAHNTLCTFSQPVH